MSPNGRNELRLYLNPLSYEVLRDGVTLVARSPIALRVKDHRLMRQAQEIEPVISGGRLMGRVKTSVYKKSSVDLNGQETLVDFGDWAIRLVARQDGVAYRFETRLPGTIRVMGERADIVIPDDKARCWLNYTESSGCEETLGVTCAADAIRTDNAHRKLVYLPLGYETQGKTVVVTESDVRDYPIWNLDEGEPVKGDVCLKGRFDGWPRRTYRDAGNGLHPASGGRWIRVEKQSDWLVDTEGTRTFPWRVFVLADCPAEVCSSDIVYALASAPDAKADFSWIKPGKVSWDWWNAWGGRGKADGCTTAGYKRYIDFAAENGLEYVILDEGWSVDFNIWKLNPKINLSELIAYGEARGVGLILWLTWAQAYGDEVRVADHFAQLGVKGFKVDFMDRGDADCTRFLERFAAACAEKHMVVDYHGAYRPNGLQRRFPNVLNYEGVHGLEHMKWSSNVDILNNDVKAAFLRMTAGPLDYTPGAMDNYAPGKYQSLKAAYSHPGSLGSRARQMAMLALYEAPLQMLCDSPENYRSNPESLSFMAAIPTVWDETVGIGGDPDSFVAVARRSGDVWYVAGICGTRDQVYELDTRFLGSGTWRMESFRDCYETWSDPQRYVHERLSAHVGETFVFRMVPGGGFIARFEK